MGGGGYCARLCIHLEAGACSYCLQCLGLGAKHDLLLKVNLCFRIDDCSAASSAELILYLEFRLEQMCSDRVEERTNHSSCDLYYNVCVAPLSGRECTQI